MTRSFLVQVTSFTLALAATELRSEERLLSHGLLHNTVRIVASSTNGTSVGTGFFYRFDYTNSENYIPVIVSCWHVVSGSTGGLLQVSLVHSNAQSQLQEHVDIGFTNFASLWIRHPDTNIDLAVLPIAEAMILLNQKGKFLDAMPVNDNLIPSQSELAGLGVFQEVKFIGYPIGLWDETNNLPIIRRGMTATDPAVDYNGRSEFLIDAACFPGSSGSPVYIASDGMTVSTSGLIGKFPPRLLGILYAGPVYGASGQIHVVTIPNSYDFRAKTQIPINLGFVIKANRLKEFAPLLRRVADEVQKRVQANTK
jgi:hypothetical protein